MHYMHTVHTLHKYIHTYMHANVYTHAYIHTYMHACMHACAHIYMHARIHTCTHTYIHTYMDTCMLNQFSPTSVTSSVRVDSPRQRSSLTVRVNMVELGRGPECVPDPPGAIVGTHRQSAAHPVQSECLERCARPGSVRKCTSTPIHLQQ